MAFLELLSFTQEHAGKNTSEYQVYNNKHQINIKQNDVNICNIYFYDGEAYVYRCPRNGFCDYSNPAVFGLTEEIPAWCRVKVS